MQIFRADKRLSDRFLCGVTLNPQNEDVLFHGCISSLYCNSQWVVCDAAILDLNVIIVFLLSDVVSPIQLEGNEVSVDLVNFWLN